MAWLRRPLEWQASSSLGETIIWELGWIQIVSFSPGLHQITPADLTLQVDQTENVFWSTLETSIALIAINLPALGRLFSEVSPKKLLQTVRSSSSNSQSQPLAERQLPNRDRREMDDQSATSESSFIPASVLIRPEASLYPNVCDLEAQTARSFFAFPEPHSPPLRSPSKLALAKLQNRDLDR